MKYRRVFSAAVRAMVAAIALMVGACSSGSLNPVTGKLLVNGQPAAGATLVFHPESADIQATPPSAVAGADGTFSVHTGDQTGARAGRYVVTIVWPEPKKLTEKEVMMGGNPNDGPDRLKGRYASVQGSSVRVEIKAGKNELEPIDLK